MQVSAKYLIEHRKSVRTFEAAALREEDRQKLTAFLAELDNPFQVPVCFRLLKAREHGLSSPVILGAEEYLAVKAERVPHFELALGYSFERVCLYACSLGIGTVMLAGTLNRAVFEAAMEVGDNEVMPMASPLGYPAAKPSIRESVMRKAIKADQRKPFERLFFRDRFDRPLNPREAGVYAGPLELVRWAPSAANGQPWRAVLQGDRVHFYEARSMKDNALGDIQKVDLGIALAHFDLGRQEAGLAGSFVFEDPGIPAPEKTGYIVSFRQAL